MNHVDRYAAAKQCVSVTINWHVAVAELENMLAAETEDRIRLEAAGSAVGLGSSLGEEEVASFIWDNEDRPDLRMEAVLILSELERTSFTHEQLTAMASDQRFKGDEIRQAAVWGLGKTGLKSYVDLLPFIDDLDENVALHAIGAFGADTSDTVTTTS